MTLEVRRRIAFKSIQTAEQFRQALERVRALEDAQAPITAAPERKALEMAIASYLKRRSQ